MANDVSEAAKRDNEARREARENDRKQREEQITKDRADQEKANNEKMQRESKYRPTPTPEEILKAAAGHHVDNKEPDGSPEQNPHHQVANAAQQIEVGRKIAEARPVGADKSGYQTRASAPAVGVKPEEKKQ